MSLKISNKIKSILEKFVNYNEFSKHHINSYNRLVNQEIPKFIKLNQEYTLFEIIEKDTKFKYFLKISDPKFLRPEVKEYNSLITQINPLYCLIRNLSYTSKLTINISLHRENLENNKIQSLNKKSNYEICDFPIMIGSCLDPNPLEKWDIPGYFIVKGAERIIMCLEQIGRNFIFHNKDETGTSVNIYSSVSGYRFLNKISLCKTKIILSFQPINTKLNSLAIIRYLGYSDKQIMDETCKDNPRFKLMLLAHLEAQELENSETCKNYLFRTLSLESESQEIKKSRLDYIIDKYLLIHIGDKPQARILKAKLLCQMISQTFKLKLEIKTPKKLDSYEYKRVKVAGNLLEELFKVYFNKLLTNFKQQVLKSNNRDNLKIITLFKSDILSNGILNSLTTGNWVGGRQKVTNILDRINPISAISCIRKIISPLLKTQQHTQARLIDPTHRGRIDPIDTPHGLNSGLIKSLAIGVRISQHINLEKLKSVLKSKLSKFIFKI
jgi:DNA-directed RNA polymerase subunit B"